MALSSLNLAKHFLKVPLADLSRDYLLQRLVDAADAAVKRYVDRDIEQATYTDFYDGNGLQDLVLRQYPVTSVTSVHVDQGGYYGQAAGAFAASTLQTAGTDYALVLDDGSTSRSGVLRRLTASFLGFPLLGIPYSTLAGGRRGPIWPMGQGNIKAIYVAGYAATAIPADLVEATNQLAAWFWRNGQRGGLQVIAESLKDYQYTLGVLQQVPELGTTRQLLSRWKRIPV